MSRMCLKANRDLIGSQCSNYMEKVNPSVIEYCYDTVQKYCKTVESGESRIHQCILDREAKGDKLSADCVKFAHESAPAKDRTVSDKNMHTKTDFSFEYYYEPAEVYLLLY
jgi:hypothetical protein